MIKYILVLTLFLSLPFQNALVEEIKIPVIVGQTGVSQLFGNEELNAYKMAAEEWNAKGGINGKKIKLIVEDSATNSKTILSAFNKLALDKPMAILGPTWLDGFQHIIKPASRNNILFVTPSSSIESFKNFNHFTFYYNTTNEIKFLMNYLNKNKLDSNITIVYEIGKFSEMLVDLVKNNKNNKTSLDIHSFQSSDIDFKSSIFKIKKKNPDVILLFLWNDRGLLTFLKDLNLYLPNKKIATIHDGEGWLKNKTIQNEISNLIYTKYIINNKEFIDKYNKKYNKKPLLTASNAYDAANALFEGLSKSNNSNELRKYIAETEFNTVTFGKVKLGKEGFINSNDIEIIEYKK